MSNPQQPEKPTAFPVGGISLGGLEAGSFDQHLTPPPPTPTAEALPRYALLSFHKSGGLRFQSRGVLVYRNGWVVPLPAEAGRRRKLGPADLAALKHELLRSRIGQIRPRPGQPQPDGYSYTLVTHQAGHEQTLELDAEAVPAALQRLLRRLKGLLM